MESSRVRVSFGRKKESRIPDDRIVLKTGLKAAADEQLTEFRKKCEDAASRIDIAEVWEVVRDEPESIGIDDLTELYWGSNADSTQKIALMLYLEQDNLHFVREKEAYIPRSEEAVQDILLRRKRDAESAGVVEGLIGYLSRNELPSEMTSAQKETIQHLRGYVIHGDNYTRSSLARDILGKLKDGPRDLQRRGFELLTSTGVFSPDEPLELERAGILEPFAEDALAEATGINLDSVLAEPARQNLTAIPSFTIDDAGTLDKDDALSVEVDESDDDKAVYRVGIHIADASALIPIGSALDREADTRMATLYMPERKVYMVPPELSDKTGSLLPDEERVALSLLVRITETGDVLDMSAVPSVIKSQAALSYEEGDKAIGDASHPWHEQLASLNKIAVALKKKREDGGAINVDRPEMLVKVSSSGEVKVRVIPRATAARSMVAEFMILCNSLLAEFCSREDIPAAYRSQPTPDLKDLPELPDGPLRWYMTLRRFAPAEIKTTPGHHGSLGVSAYMQVSSPLRRYPDLVLQRQISHFLATGKPYYSTEEIASVAQRADVQIRELGKIEDERRRYWFLKYLKELHGLQKLQGKDVLFDAIVLDNQPGRYAQLELTDYPFRVRTQLPQSCEPGQSVTLRLHGVDLWRRIPQLVHVPSG
jgi:exoribonuclease-2